MRRFGSTLQRGACCRTLLLPLTLRGQDWLSHPPSRLRLSLHLSVSRPRLCCRGGVGAEGCGGVRLGSPGGVCRSYLRGSCGREGGSPSLSAAVQTTSLVWALPAPSTRPHRGGGLSFSLRQPFLRKAERRRFTPHLPFRGLTRTRGRVGACAPVEEEARRGERAPPLRLGALTGAPRPGPKNLGTHNTQRGAGGLALAVGRAAPGTQLNSLRPEGVWGVQCLLPRPTPWPRGGMERPGLSD